MLRNNSSRLTQTTIQRSFISNASSSASSDGWSLIKLTEMPEGTFKNQLAPGGIFTSGSHKNTYTITNVMSSGGQGKTYKCVDQYQNIVVVKLLRCENVDESYVNCVEYNLSLSKETKKTHSRYIIYLIDGFTVKIKNTAENNRDEQFICVVTEYCANGSLNVQNHSYDITVSLALQFIFQSGLGLDKFHRVGFVHMDLKPDNYFIREFTPSKLQLVIGDLGIAQKYQNNHELEIDDVDESEDNTTDLGTNGYRDPIYLKYGEITPSCDIWGMGITLLEFISKQWISSSDSFEKLSETQRYKYIDNIFEMILNKNDKEKEEWSIIRNVIKGMLKENINERWSILDVFRAIFTDTVNEISFASNFKILKNYFNLNESVVITCLQENGRNLQYVDNKFHARRDIIEMAVSQNGLSYEYIKSNQFKYDKNVIQIAYQSDPNVIELVPKHFRTNDYFSMTMLSKVSNLQNLNIIDSNDIHMIMVKVKIDGMYLQLASNELKDNYELVKESVKCRGISLQHASDNLKKNYEICHVAISQNGMALEFVDIDTIDEELAFKSVQCNGLALEFVPPILKTEHVIKRAIRSNGAAIRFIPNDLLDQYALNLFIENEESMSMCVFLRGLEYVQKCITNSDKELQDYLECVLLNKFEEHIVSSVAIRGYLNAQYNLAYMYDNGYGVSQDYMKAVEWYSKSANQGYSNAQYNLALMYYNGEGILQDYLKAFEWFLKSAEQGDSKAQFNLALMYYNGEGISQDYMKAFEWFLKSAERGNAAAQNNLALMYYNGEGILQDYLKAFEWYSKSAEQGDSDAQHNLALMYYNGIEVSQDYMKAFEWFLKSGEQGFSQAQYNLAYMYKNGQGTLQDYMKAVEWYLKSAEQGDSNAQFNLAYMYDNGIGVSQDYMKAFEWYSKSAEQGNSNAQFNLAYMYDNGEGIPQDYMKAVEWYLKSAEQGNPNAQFNLAHMYNNGNGISQDYMKAVEWFSKSAEQGNSDAQNNLAQIYYNGIEVSQDYMKAFEWFSKSAEQGNRIILH